MPALIVQSIANLWTWLDVPVRLWTTGGVRLRVRQCARPCDAPTMTAGPLRRLQELATKRKRRAITHRRATKEVNPADQLSECPFKVA
jgi:hypothetical protein